MADGYLRDPETLVGEPPLALQQIAGARLAVDGWDVTGIERCTGINVAFMVDTDVAWLFLDEAQPDTNYIVMPADGVTKFEDYIEVTRPGLAEISIVIFRVQ